VLRVTTAVGIHDEAATAKEHAATMTDFEYRTFGTRREDLEYVTRPGAYALIVRDGQVLTVEEESGTSLPGGGMEGDETPEEALRRELIEETGFAVDRARRLGRADEWFVKPSGMARHKVCYVYRVALVGRVREESATDCPSRWLAPAAAIDELYQEAFRWIVDRYAAPDAPH
jgi:8-oxo-dGTP diphosphatase